MKVAYIFSSTTSHKILDKMILPQLESGKHGAEVAGMFFFMDNTFFLTKGNSVGERLSKIASETGMIIMGCDQCVLERGIENNLVDGATIGCFPNLYACLGGANIDQVITL
ncbi:MAG: sulfur reduction protein DsrE [Clostridioides sp.]|jgi:sulfur relay (sulfurtransferase) complex TusBCD TusD component (DsrE family)|nr:sulfur reduction protein DsrE [Clostridioides sp.]